MIRRIDYKALMIGILVYFLGMFLLDLIAASLLKGLGQLFDYSAQRIVDSYGLEFVLAAGVTFWAGYCVNRLSRRQPFDQSIVLALALLIFHLIGTIYALFDTDGAPLYINLLYDSIVTIAIVAGGYYAKRRKRKVHERPSAETAV